MDRIYTLKELDVLADDLIIQFKQVAIWAFYAPMGAGKTTLISLLCQKLGVQQRASSPTFSIMNEYQGENGKVIYHMDWYRIQNEAEAKRTGIEFALENSDYCFVEWPENAPQLLQDHCIRLQIDIIDPLTRRIFIR